MKIRKFLSSFDYILFFTVITLTILGVLFIYSSVLNKPAYSSRPWKHLAFFIASIIIFISILFIPPKLFKSATLWIYIFCMIGLFITLFLYDPTKGQKRFSFFGLSFQFSELMKIAVILFISKFYSNKSENDRSSIFNYLLGFLIIIFPMFLIFLQPDLGTLLVYIPIYLSISFIAGVKKRYILFTVLLFLTMTTIPIITSINEVFYNNENSILYLFTNLYFIIIIFAGLSIIMGLSFFGFLIIPGISKTFKKVFYWILFFSCILSIGLALSYPINWKLDKDSYQKDRIKVFLNPKIDLTDTGYNIDQAKTAIGNGGIFGRGWRKGPHTQKNFLPERETDFIYPVIAEEWGFIRGSLFILILYSLIFYRGFFIILKVRHYYETYVIIGILTMFLYHIIQNIGMCIGIMPITGIPLPFLSYGGSFLITCFIGIAILMNFELNRYQY